MKSCITNFIVHVHILVYLPTLPHFFRNLLFGRENLGISENPTEWFVHSKKHARQTDSTSCGVFVLKVFYCGITMTTHLCAFVDYF